MIALSDRRVEEVAAERVLGREGDRVQDAVDAAPALAQVLRDGLDVLGLVDVELEHVGHGVELAGGALGHALGAAEAGQDDLGARRLGLLGDLERDRLAVDDAGDQELLALQRLTAGSSSRGRAWPAGAGPRDVMRPPGRARRCGRRSRTTTRARSRACRRCPAAWPSWGRSRGPAPRSGSSSPSVGGAIRSRSARIVATASTAPAAPSRCPIADFSEEIGILYAWSPSAILSARGLGARR